jgi:yeast amino acid transporter
MSAEKDNFAIGAEAGSDSYAHERKASNVGEAADIYGDIATAEEFGYVERG